MRFAIAAEHRRMSVRVRVPYISLLRCGFAGFLFTTTLLAQSPKPFTLQQVMSAPYATELTPAPTGNLFAWVEDSEGRHNLWVGGPDTPARQLTHNTADDGLDLTDLTWSPDATAIAATYGTETGADGKPSNPAHLQRSVEPQVILQPVEPGAQAVHIGAGHAPSSTLSTTNSSSSAPARSGPHHSA